MGFNQQYNSVMYNDTGYQPYSNILATSEVLVSGTCVYSGSSSMVGKSNVFVANFKYIFGKTYINSTSDMRTYTIRTVYGGTSLTGKGVIELNVGTTKYGSVAISNVSLLHGRASITARVTFNLISTASVSSKSTRVLISDSDLYSKSSLLNTGTIAKLGSLSISGLGIITSKGMKKSLGTISVSGNTLLVSRGFRNLVGKSTISSEGNLEIVYISPQSWSIPLELIIWRDLLIDNQDINLLGLTLNRDSKLEAIPSLTLREVRLPGRDGSIIVGKKIDSRMLTLNLSAGGMDEDDYNRIKDTFATLLSNKNPLTLIFEDDPDIIYLARYHSQISVREWIRDGILEIPMKMHDPYLYGRYNITSDLITNLSIEPMDLSIIIKGPANSPINISIGSYDLTINKDLSIGDTIVLDSSNMTARLNGDNIWPFIEGDIPILNKGEYPAICSSGQMAIQYREKWLVAPEVS